jgi:hypothetical protein
MHIVVSIGRWPALHACSAVRCGAVREVGADGEACVSNSVRTEREDGSLGGEDEDGGGDELRDGGADGVRVRGVLAPPHREPPPRLHARGRAHVVRQKSSKTPC